jgi:calcineurin-like phosphoesterase family protein
MANTFLIADTHFGHKNIVNFVTKDGTPVRPWDDVDEMDEAMVDRWNDVVGPKDKVYVAGDVVINRRSLATVGRLNGDKVLIKGNHDIFRLKEYSEHFRDVRAYHVWVKLGIFLSHVPIHPMELARFGCNVHGHLHTNRVLTSDGQIDPRYLCVSAEHTDFAPISLEEVKARILAQGGRLGLNSEH